MRDQTNDSVEYAMWVWNKYNDAIPDGRVNPSEIGYSPDGPLTKLIKPKCPNTSHM